MAISPGYNQFPRQRVPQVTPGINSSNVALKALKEQQDAQEAAKLAAKNQPVPQKVIVVAAPTPTPSVGNTPE